MLLRLFVLKLHLMHFFIVIFSLFAWLVPYKSVLIFHLAWIPLMIIQWKLNRNTCILSNLEALVLGKSVYGLENEGQFIKRMLAKFINPLPSDKTIETITYLLLALAWSLSLLKLIS